MAADGSSALGLACTGLEPVAVERFRPESVAKAESLLQDATAFKNRLATAMKNPSQRNHIHTSWRDNDESNEAYSDFGPELEQLFDRTRTVFELARFDVARSTYEQLFEALSLQDVYGFGIHRPEGLDVREERGRYLRSVMEATPEKQPRTSARLRAALVEAIGLWRAPSEISKPLETAAKICLKRVNALVEVSTAVCFKEALPQEASGCVRVEPIAGIAQQLTGVRTRTRIPGNVK